MRDDTIDEIVRRCSHNENHHHENFVDIKLLLALIDAASSSKSRHRLGKVRKIARRLRDVIPIDTNAITKIFQRYDLRVTGRVNPHDFKAVLRVICGDDVSNHDIEELLRFTESNAGTSTSCDYMRFLSLLRNPSEIENNDKELEWKEGNVSDLLSPFYQVDLSGAGILSRRSFYSIVKKHPILYRVNKDRIEACCHHRNDDMIDYESFCREFASSSSSSSSLKGNFQKKTWKHNNTLLKRNDNMWRRLRRWSQDLISEGVTLEASLKEWNGSAMMPRHEFRECLTYLGVPIRGENEWYALFEDISDRRPEIINTKRFLSMLQPSEEMSAECRLLREKLMRSVYRRGSAYVVFVFFFLSFFLSTYIRMHTHTHTHIHNATHQFQQIQCSTTSKNLSTI